MEHHGGPAAPPRPPKPEARVHAPAHAPVSLERPRPHNQRDHNAYVEAPRRGAAPRACPTPAPVTAQPDKRAPAAQTPTPPPPASLAGSDSIVCGACGRCRCEQCALPRPLPSRWLGGFCLCSAEAAVDYASCMCCVKAALYHCARGEEEAACADEPCACAGRRRAARWGCVAAASLVLPCLCLYWPIRACAALTERAYGRATLSGCRCPPDKLLAGSPAAPPP